MWERVAFWVVVIVVIVVAIAGLSWFGAGMKVEIYRSTVVSAPVTVTSAPVVTPVPAAPVDPTLKAIAALSDKIDSKFGHVEQRLNDLDGRVKQLESLTAPPPSIPSPCGTCWTEEIIPPHQ